MRARLAVAVGVVAVAVTPFLVARAQVSNGVLAYDRGGTIYVATGGGENEKPYAQGFAPALAIGDPTLVYSRRSGGATQLFARSLDSDGPERQVTHLDAQEATFGEGRYGVMGSTWSPGHEWIALRLMEGSTTTLAIVRPDGSGFHRFQYGHLFGSAIAWRNDTSLAVGTDTGVRLVSTDGTEGPLNGTVNGDVPAVWGGLDDIVVNTAAGGIADVNESTGERRDLLANAVAWDVTPNGDVLYTTATELGSLTISDPQPAPVATLPAGGQVTGGIGVGPAPLLTIVTGGSSGIWTTRSGVNNGGGATSFGERAQTTELVRVADGDSATLTTAIDVSGVQGLGASVFPEAATPLPNSGGFRSDARSRALAHAPGPVDPPPGRSAFSHALPAANDVSTSAGAIAVNVLVTMALLLLVTFPSELFNKTLEEHYDEVRGWFHLSPRREPVEKPRRARLLAFAAYVAAAGVLYSLLDPHAGLDGTTFRLWLGLAIGLATVTLLFGLGHVLYRRHEHGFLRVLPGTLAVGVACVVVSRLTSFEPGYLYGIVGGFAFATARSERDEGREEAVAAAWVFVAALVAWLAWLPVDHAADRGNPSLLLGLADTTLSAIAVGGLEGLVLGLVPLRSLPGHKVFRWDRRVWAVMYGVVMFVFVHLLLHPSSGLGAEAHADAFLTWLGLFVGFGVVSVAFWWYFQRRPEPVSSG
jgi:hypothetical protein